MLALALFAALTLPPMFDLTGSEVQQTYAQVHFHRLPGTFSTASEAAYAAALTYGKRILNQEIGAKIYVDNRRSGPQYSFGKLIGGEYDPETSEAEIEYAVDQTDGHYAVVGLWHEHPTDDTWMTLYGHDDDVRQTKHAVWTSIGTQLFVQFWNGRAVVPAWDPSSQIPPLCTNCVTV